jgi:GT2 family glycosyltransferase
MAQPEIAVLVSSFERPGHLRRVLTSIAAQRGIGRSLEVVITDDGSRDDTPRLVRRFAASVGFPVRFTTHSHDGFQLARCRNEGVQASTAPYLLFLDGDCLIPPDHLRTHLDRRRPGYVMAGYPIHLNENVSEQVSESEVRDATYLSRVSLGKCLAMRWRHVRALGYSLLGHPTRPKLLGGNLGIARGDYERINGYDENFRGWGCEDDDLRMRLKAAGVSVASIAWWTSTYHLWHPKTPSAPATWRAGVNVEYLQRPLRLTRCLAGLTKRRLQDVRIQFVGRIPAAETINGLLPLWCRVAATATNNSSDIPEIEISFADPSSQFSGRCNGRVLVIPPGHQPSRDQLWHADVIFSDQSISSTPTQRVFPLHALDITLQQQLGHLPTASASHRRANDVSQDRLCVPAVA